MSLPRTRIVWTDGEISLLAAGAITLMSTHHNKSRLSLVKTAQKGLPKSRQRTLNVMPQSVDDRINELLLESNNPSPGSASTIPVQSPSLAGFSNDQLVEELGLRLVKDAVRECIANVQIRGSK